jgi:pimeloyl-ACP methyl ester carboxylesterase
MQRKIVRINNLDIHYRITGNGPLLFLLHPSPLSSEIFVPFMQLLAKHFTVVAPDTPGYGYSDSLPTPPQNINDYTFFLRSFFQHFTTNKFYLYGSATGAQLAIAYSLENSNAIAHLYLDNAAHFTPEQKETLFKNYFIDTTPQSNGTHLTTLWQHIEKSTQYFPWYSTNEADCISPQPAPANVLQFIVNQYLLAGTNYADAYKCAFINEDAKYVQQILVPTTIFKWLGSPILKYIEQLLQHQLPKNISVTEVANNENRFKNMLHIMETNLLR